MLVRRHQLTLDLILGMLLAMRLSSCMLLAGTCISKVYCRAKPKLCTHHNGLLPDCCSLHIDTFVQDGLYERLYIVHETDARESGPSITISVNGESHSMTVQEISQMPLKQFAFLWTVRRD